ncbi:MAG: T9SS type A sorting domain-containing protein, partial [Bacteroidia bacterium]
SPTAVAVNGQITDVVSTNGLPSVNVVFEGQTNYSFVTNGTGDYNSCSVIADTYTVTSGAWGYITQCSQQTINSNNTIVNLALRTGWYDDFVFDFGWTSTGTATTGSWERGEPIGTDYISSGDANPEFDVNSDCSNQCYVTGNIGGQASQGDVDGGTAILTSPAFDLTGYTNPYVHYDRWFFNAGGQNNPNDSLIISITNGSQTVVLETVTANSAGNSAWQHRMYQLGSVINLTSTMRMIVKTGDTPQGNLVEAAFDHFMVVDSSGSAIAENALNNQVSVYPNPYNGSGVVTYSLAQVPAAGAYMEVTDVAGRVISVMPVVNQQGTLVLSADVPAGIYMVRLVQAGEASASLKLVKTN